MKRLFLLATTILIAFCSLSAQSKEILLKPNWTIGDIMHYQKNVKQINVDINNDTTIKKQGNYDFYLKVIDKNDLGYTLRLDYPSSIYAQILPNLQSLEFKDYLSIDFTTDLGGSFIELKNLDSLQNFMNELFDKMYDVLASTEKPMMSKEEYLTYMKKVFSPEMQIASLVKDIDLILWQNGIEAEIGYSYKYQTPVNMSGVEIPTTTIFSLDAESHNGTPILYIVESETEYDKDSLKFCIPSFLQEIVASFPNKENSKSAENELKNFFSNAEMSIVDYKYSELPIETGCVYYAQYVREIIFTNPNGNMSQIRVSEVQQMD